MTFPQLLLTTLLVQAPLPEQSRPSRRLPPAAAELVSAFAIFYDLRARAVHT